jgi:predicted 3-demethylubiquinone-9 3-methyltransferase (glyoxalase superfamily)
MEGIRAITPCLWFDAQAEQAATLYTGIFRHSKITKVTRYTEAGKENHGREPGSVMTVEFELDGQTFTALNGGPLFQFSEAISFQIDCRTQEEIDHYWSRLGEGGDPKAQVCGWLKDRFGVSWQVVPAILRELLSDADPAKVMRTTTAMMKMKKLDIAGLKRAHAGEGA